MSAGLLAALREALGPSGLLTEAADQARYLQDWRGNFPGRALAVALPASTAEVSAVVKLCAAAGVAIVPQGGNTGLVGGSVPDASGRELVLSLQRLNRVREVDPLCNAITVEAGCILQTVQEEAARHGRLFPLALGAQGSAMIGGNLSTNAGGEQVLRYGNARDLALGLEVVLPDGRVLDALSPLRKDNTGYDLKQLFIGAEGTLGIITAASLKLYPLPSAQATAWLAVPDPQAAVSVLARLRDALGDRVTAFEIMGRGVLDLVLRHFAGTRDPLPGAAAWQVLTDISDSGSLEELNPKLEAALGALMEDGLVLDAAVAASGAQREAMWQLRNHIPEAQRLEGPSIKHDVSMPITRIPEFIARAAPLLESAVPGIRVMCFGHVGDGNLHFNQSAPLQMGAADFKPCFERVHQIVHGLAVELRGSISAEHGIGRLKQDDFVRFKNPLAIELMQRVKQALDPMNLMNPGRLLPPRAAPESEPRETSS
ncbi:MAG TPA: FAD-binding oxidoreductase [Ideonella sp.]|nr:FAD-binding oxidoreductase [Ideonella sp.]